MVFPNHLIPGDYFFFSSFINEKIGLNPSSLLNFPSCICINGMKTQALNSLIRLFGCSNNIIEVNALLNFYSEILVDI